MPDQIIYECQAFLPSLKRAQKRVPPEFLPCYDWFRENAGEKISRLPHRMEKRPDTPIPLSRDSGIYIPSASRVAYVHGRRYALSVHSSNTEVYDDQDPLPLADGTWLLDYAAHEGSDISQSYNKALMNCLSDGIPVGVMTAEPEGGYRVLGLAFVERYNSATHMFTLHGPVTPETEAQGSFILPELDDLLPDEQQLIASIDETDERRIVMAEQVRRERQDEFRALLLQAYEGTCAVTRTAVAQVLQAAHINPYRGRKSQVASNGILLRADLHLLYDAHLVSVEPDSLRIHLSERLSSTVYAKHHLQVLRVPEDPRLAPSPDLLALHYEQFRRENNVLVA